MRKKKYIIVITGLIACVSLILGYNLIKRQHNVEGSKYDIAMVIVPTLEEECPS